LISSIYITRSLSEVPRLKSFCDENRIILHGYSQISFTPIDFTVRHSFDVIFFSSPRSARFFLEKNTIAPNIAIACVGKGTAEYVLNLGFEADFIGEKTGDPSENAADLAKWLGKRRILFPVSDISKGSMLKFIPESQLEIVPVYKTAPETRSVNDHDIYIFTSPSNISSFLLKNETPDRMVVAWGKSTEQTLLELSIPVTFTLMKSDEEELVGRLYSLL
jgi:uroporphyrinogen-III synthase